MVAKVCQLGCPWNAVSCLFKPLLMWSAAVITSGKPSLIVQLDADQIIEPAHIIRWIKGHFINSLNIAGPRESKYPGGIYEETYAYLDKVFTLLKESA